MVLLRVYTPHETIIPKLTESPGGIGDIDDSPHAFQPDVGGGHRKGLGARGCRDVLKSF